MPQTYEINKEGKIIKTMAIEEILEIMGSLEMQTIAFPNNLLLNTPEQKLSAMIENWTGLKQFLAAELEKAKK
jgi:hypothetical protein